MEEKFSVAISYKENLGYIEYDAENKKAAVVLDNEEGKKKVEEFLSQVHEIEIPHETLLDFTAEKIDPLANEKNLELALTRLWEATEVHVDWSRPVDYVKAHPHY